MILLPLFENTHRGIEVHRFLTKNGKLFPIAYFLRVEKDTNFIIPRFALAKFSIIEFLLKNKNYHQKDGKQDLTQSYDIFKDYIKIHICKGVTACIISYENKFLQEFIDFETSEKLERADKWKKPSVAQDGKSQLMLSICKTDNWFAQKTIFDKIFPQPVGGEFEYWLGGKETVTAFYYLKAPAEYKRVYSYDIKSSFAARVYNRLFPQGNGEYFSTDDEIPAKKWYIKKIMVFSIKSKIYDFLDFEKKFKEEKKKYIILYITKDIEEILSLVYDIKYKTVDGYFYKLQRTIFNDFIEENIFAKNNDFDPLKKYNKARCNTFWGTFGRRDEITETSYYIDENKPDFLKFKTETKVIEEKSYYPMYLYINGQAKAALIRAILPHFSKLLYANTDGFFLKSEADFDYINAVYSSKIGRIEFRTIYNRVALKDISNYCGEIIDENGEIFNDTRISGRKHNNLTYDEFCAGFQSTFYTLTEYGFLIGYYYNELPIKEYSRIFDLRRKIEEYLPYFSIKQREEVLKFEEDAKTEQTGQLYMQILDELEFQAYELLFPETKRKKEDKERENELKTHGVKITIGEEIRSIENPELRRKLRRLRAESIRKTHKEKTQ